MITTGVTGQTWRASVSAWGSVQPWGDDADLNWFIAADDRWHIPSDESAVRQVRMGGTAVAETRVRVPNGDVVQRVYSVPNAGGITIVEVENESTMPVAVAFDRRNVMTEHPIADVPIEGIDLPTDSFVMPLGHAATLRIGLGHVTPQAGPLPAGLPLARQVANGWETLTARASRFELPPGDVGATLAERVTAERCEIALGSIPVADDDPIGFALSLNELVRMGEDADPWLPELASAVEKLGPLTGWEADVALDAVGRVLQVAGEARAHRDLVRISAGRDRAPRPASPPEGVGAIAWLEGLLVDSGSLMPGGIPAVWLGQSLDVHGLPTTGESSVSFALRWHGERPAVLWEQQGDPVELVSPTAAPDWKTREIKGEALWPAPPIEPQPAPDISFT